MDIRSLRDWICYRPTRLNVQPYTRFATAEKPISPASCKLVRTQNGRFLIWQAREDLHLFREIFLLLAGEKTLGALRQGDSAISSERGHRYLRGGNRVPPHSVTNNASPNN